MGSGLVGTRPHSPHQRGDRFGITVRVMEGKVSDIITDFDTFDVVSELAGAHRLPRLTTGSDESNILDMIRTIDDVAHVKTLRSAECAGVYTRLLTERYPGGLVFTMMIGTTSAGAIWIPVQALQQAFVSIDQLASHCATSQYIAKWGPIIAKSQQITDLPERAGPKRARYEGLARKARSVLPGMSWEQQQPCFAPARFESLAHDCSPLVQSREPI